MKSKLCLAVIILGTLATGCHREKVQNIDGGQKQKTKVYTEAELRQLVIPGMSVTDLTNKFSIPGSVFDEGAGHQLIFFDWVDAIRHNSNGIRMIGFKVDIKDDKVIKWSSSMELSQMTSPLGPKPAYSQHLFQFYLVTDDLTNVANSVDSDKMPGTNAITKAPDLTVNAAILTGTNGDEPPGKISVILMIDNNSTSELTRFTEKNFGKRVLIVFRDKIIAAPIVSTPTDATQFTFMINDSGIFDDIANR